MIPVQNVYYMLSYAFRVLREQGYKRMETEPFSNIGELCAAILTKGIAIQLKRGLGKEYIPQTDTMSAIRGKIDLTESMKTRTMLKRQMVCEYDAFSVNTYMNQVLKTTLELLLRSDLSKSRKKEIRKLLIFFSEVDELNIHHINWNFQYNRTNQTYQMLISICYLIVKGLLQTNSDGTKKIIDVMDEQRMSRLYEKFLFEYFKQEHPHVKTTAPQIPWQLDDDMNTMLPLMQADIMLEKDGNLLIIDAKYYAKTLQTHYDVHKLHSGNLYQIFTYVKNKASQQNGAVQNVSGMLLYAKTDEMTLPDHTYRMSGNQISAKTLNLDCSFEEIANQLDAIVEDHFGCGAQD